MADKKHRQKRGNRRIGRINATVLPQYEVAVALYAQIDSNLTTASRVVETALHEFFTKRNVSLPSREQVAAHMGKAWVAKHDYKIQNGGDAVK